MVEEEQSFVRIEVPIVNVSGTMVDNEGGVEDEAFDPEEAFDFLFDVTPR